MKIGAQVFTIRQYCQNKADFRESMRRLSQMGYSVVQISAIGQMPSEYVRQVCDEYGLEICLTHSRGDAFMNNLQGVIDQNKAYGCRYVGLGMGDERYFTTAWMNRFPVDYLPVCRRLQEENMRFMYHTHTPEFAKAPDGRYVLEHFFEGISPEMFGVTLDLYWLQFSGLDVISTIEKMQDVIPCVHLKDAAPAMSGVSRKMMPVGDGNMGYARIMDKLAEIGKTEYALVEQDDCNGEDPFTCLERSRKFLENWAE